MFLSTISIVAALLAAETELQDSLKAVTIAADREAVVPGTDTVQIQNKISITDAFSAVPGVYVSDYGGLAGLKSVSLRGMGSSHTAVYVDGVRVGNVQSGQADLGMLDLENCGSAVIDYAQNSVSFNTARPKFTNRNIGGRFRFRGGSFGTYEPLGRLDFRLSDKVSLSATGGGVLSRGDFPLQDGTLRSNNDIRQIRTGLDSWGIMDGGEWHAKAYYNGSDRGTPGSATWPSTDRQKDRNAFVQGVMHKQFTTLYRLDFSAKAAYDDLLYLSEFGDNRYKQKEIQLNTAHRFKTGEWLDASVSADFRYDGLDSDLYTASRTSVFAAASAAFHPKRFRADVTLEYSGAFDRGGEKRNIISPAIDIRWNALKGLDLLAFARRSYRAPTFNELYYPGYGNPELKAEDAWLTDLGIEYNPLRGGFWHMKMKADGFFNILSDKIISAPSDLDPNVWLPYNVGRARMAGFDLQASLNYCRSELKSSITARYGYQSAIDRTPGSSSFGKQIPYLARHTVSLGADASFRGWNLALNWNWRGGRYDSAGPMPDYGTLDVTAGKEIELPKDLALCLKVMARNITGCRYELAGGYPMPGRSLYGGIDIRF